MPDINKTITELNENQARAADLLQNFHGLTSTANSVRVQEAIERQSQAINAALAGKLILED